MHRLVRDEIALERRHLVLAEQRRIGAAAQIPQKVLPVLALQRARRGEIALTRLDVRRVNRLAPAQRLVRMDGNRREIAVFLHRDAAVVEQIAVAAQIHAARAV